jgi:Asp-tRNA(Asn)/Glu-tRNA(Gln) amidotransferase A subunit family amidase
MPSAVLAVDGTSFGAVDDEMLAAFDTALESLSNAGVRVDRSSMAECGHWPDLHKDMMAFEAAVNFSREYDLYGDRLSVEFRSLLDAGRSHSLQDRFEMFVSLRKALRQFDEFMDRYDAIITPSAPGAAPPGLGATGDPAMSRPWQLAGSCQCTLPCATDANGMPLGIQLIGRRYHDESLLSFAKWIQETLRWHSPLPLFRNDGSGGVSPANR